MRVSFYTISSREFLMYVKSKKIASVFCGVFCVITHLD